MSAATILRELLAEDKRDVVLMDQAVEVSEEFEHIHTRWEGAKDDEDLLVSGLSAIAYELKDLPGTIQFYPIEGQEHIVDGDICVNHSEEDGLIEYSILVKLGNKDQTA